MTHSVDFESSKKVFLKEFDELSPIYEEILVYLKNKKSENANDTLKKLDDKKNKIDVNSKITSLPEAIVFFRQMSDYFNEVEHILLQKKYSELNESYNQNDITKLEDAIRQGVFADSEQIIRAQIKLSELKARISYPDKEKLNADMKTESDKIDNEIKKITELSYTNKVINQTSDTKKATTTDLLVPIRFEKYKTDFLLFVLKKIDDKEKLEIEKSIREDEIAKFEKEIERKKRSLPDKLNQYKLSSIELKKNKLSYLEKLMTNEKNSFMGRVIKGLLNMIPRLGESLKKRGEQKLSNIIKIENVRYDYENTCNAVNSELPNKILSAKNDINNFSEKLKQLSIIDIAKYVKETLSHKTLLGLLHIISNGLEDKALNELEKTILIDVIRENLAFVKADLKEKIDTNIDPKNKYFNIASLQEALKNFEIKFGKESLSELLKTLLVPDQELCTQILNTDQKELDKNVDLENQNKISKSSTVHPAHLNSLKEESKLSLGSSKSTGMPNSSSLSKKVDRPMPTNNNNTVQKDNHSVNVLSGSGSNI